MNNTERGLHGRSPLLGRAGCRSAAEPAKGSGHLWGPEEGDTQLCGAPRACPPFPPPKSAIHSPACVPTKPQGHFREM